MRKTKTHIPKSISEKMAYNRSLKDFNYDSTTDDKYEFSYTDDDKKDFSVQKNKGKRKKDWNKIIFNHLKDKGLAYIIGLFFISISYFVYDARFDIGIIKTKIDANKDEIKEIKDNNKILMEKIQDHALKIQENSLFYKNIEKSMQDLKIKK